MNFPNSLVVATWGEGHMKECRLLLNHVSLEGGVIQFVLYNSKDSNIFIIIPSKVSKELPDA